MSIERIEQQTWQNDDGRVFLKSIGNGRFQVIPAECNLSELNDLEEAIVDARAWLASRQQQER